MNFREIASAVYGETGYVVPDSFFGSPSPDDIQVCYLANRAAAYLREKGFQKLIKRYEITLTTAESYALPSDYLEIVPDTTMINGRIDAVNLPTTAPTWAWLKSQNSTSSYTVFARIINDELAINAPDAGEVVAFEYISNAPITDSNSETYKQRFTDDYDIWLLDDDLLILETKWRFEKAKGIDGWEVSAQESKDYRNSVMARDKSAKTIGQRTDDVLSEPYTRLWV